MWPIGGLCGTQQTPDWLLVAQKIRLAPSYTSLDISRCSRRSSLWSNCRRLGKKDERKKNEKSYLARHKNPTTNCGDVREESRGACEKNDLGCVKGEEWCDGNATPMQLAVGDGGVSTIIPVQSRKPVFTSFSRKNLTSPSSESLMPMDFSIPRSPFSTAMKTERRCSRSERIRCNAAPKSSIVCDSLILRILIVRSSDLKYMTHILLESRTHQTMRWLLYPRRREVLMYRAL